ncbi:MAG: glycosyltransferase family 4 protein [Ignavibacteriae bacterium]|nr:glycosyltransferase family 1 protein [Ignavibacteriota bacterium]NOH00037.1 glycosyltransferase family 4 protein [Ignavibacteriota bacterium]
MKKKIAYIHSHQHPASYNTLDQLIKKFPEYEVVEFDLVKIAKNNFFILLKNSFYLVKELGLSKALRGGNFKKLFFKSDYFFKQSKKIIDELLSIEEYVFTFQRNSLFETSTGKIPHFIYTDHTHAENLKYPDYNEYLNYSPKYSSREKIIFNKSTKNFVYANNIKNSLVEDYLCPEDRVAIVGVGGSVSLADNWEPINNNYKNKTIIFVGRDWNRKGGPELIRAFKKVLLTHPDAKLIIAGASPKIEIGNCEILGDISLEELSIQYSRSSIFCLPTKREPFGIVFLDAMMHKLPVVATRIAALPDLIIENENGLLVEPGDVEQLTKSLIYLLDYPELCKRFGENAHNFVKNNYTWEKVGERLRENILPFLD